MGDSVEFDPDSGLIILAAVEPLTPEEAVIYLEELTNALHDASIWMQEQAKQERSNVIHVNFRRQ